MRTAVLSAVAILGGCVVGDVDPVQTAPDEPIPPAGSAPVPPPSGGEEVPTAQLSVTYSTTQKGGKYAPSNVVVVWVEAMDGTFVRTIGRWADDRKGFLRAWVAKAGSEDPDAVSGATRANHVPPLTATWTMKDRRNQTIPDGTYVLRMELADQNSTTPDQNHQGRFTFVKGPMPQKQTGLSSGLGFINVSIDYVPAPVAP